MKVHKPKTIQDAIKDLHIFFLGDLYTKFSPEEKVGNEIWIRDDYFRNFDEFAKYLEDNPEQYTDFESQIFSMVGMDKHEPKTKRKKEKTKKKASSGESS